MHFVFLSPGELAEEDVWLGLLSTNPGNREKGFAPSYLFGIYRDRERVGTIVFRVGNRDALYLVGHIGYAVVPAARGHGYAAKGCRALFPFAKRHGLLRIIVTCNPDNTASVKTCERIGGKLLEIADVPVNHEMYQRGDRQKCVYEVIL